MIGVSALVLVPLLKRKFYATETMMLVASLVSMSLSILLHGVSVKTWMLFLGESPGRYRVVLVSINSPDGHFKGHKSIKPI